MDSYCIYSIPTVGDVTVPNLPPFHVNDIFIEFKEHEGKLSRVIVEVPIDPNSNTRNVLGDNLVTNEPRADEVEEIVLQISSGFSVLESVNVEFLFENRKIQWARNGRLSGQRIELNAGLEKPSIKKISTPIFIRSVLAGCLLKSHDPALTFYSRGTEDANAHRYIEAYYNFFFFLEFLYIVGGSGKKQTINSLLRSEEFMSSLKKAIERPDLQQLVSRAYYEKITSLDSWHLLEHIYKTRGNLHHPNSKKSTWVPGKQRDFAEDTVLLQLICLEIAITRYLKSVFTPEIDEAYNQVEKCIKQGSNIRVISRKQP